MNEQEQMVGGGGQPPHPHDHLRRAVVGGAVERIFPRRLRTFGCIYRLACLGLNGKNL